MPDFSGSTDSKWVDENGNFLDNFFSELWEIKNEVSIDALNYSEKPFLQSLEIEVLAKNFWVPGDVISEYTKILNDFYGANKIPNKPMDNKLKKQLWFDVWELKHSEWAVLYYIKKLCPKTFNSIAPLMLSMISIRLNLWDISGKSVSKYEKIKNIVEFIKKYWDSAYKYLKFCSPFDWSYMVEWLSHIHKRKWWESMEEMLKRLGKNHTKAEIDEDIKLTRKTIWSFSMLVQFVENFVEDPKDSMNLYSFLGEEPQVLSNLWWKEVKSINLNVNSWINFAFRGIIEMVKSRSDLSFPRLSEKPSNSEKNERKQQRRIIIKEYETMLRNYIAKDKVENGNAKKNTFDKIFFTMSHWYVGVDRNDDFMPSKSWVQQFSWNEVADYSLKLSEDTKEKTKQKNQKMISDIEEYVKNHPNEKILVCVNHHGSPDGSSGNWWTKNDWARLANISPNVKVRSIRCHFWTAFDNANIYKYKSSVSWFSNISVTNGFVSQTMEEASGKWLWFHEMEIFTRLHYPISVTPLSEGMEYKNKKTWKTEFSNVWLAQNLDNQDDDSNEFA